MTFGIVFWSLATIGSEIVGFYFMISTLIGKIKPYDRWFYFKRMWIWSFIAVACEQILKYLMSPM